MAANPNTLHEIKPIASGDDSRATLREQASNEIVFAVVGGAGSGTSVIAEALGNLLKDIPIGGQNFQVHILKASKVIRDWAIENHKALPEKEPKLLSSVEILQNYGDDMREGVGTGRPDYAAVAIRLITEIQRTRANSLQVPFEPGVEIIPDGTPRAYILDSIRHPSEVNLLREVYGDAFFLIGVVCDDAKRERRLHEKYEDGGAGNARRFMNRDSDDRGRKHGQHVADAFHLADFFVDNTMDREIAGSPNLDWTAGEDLSRLIKVITAYEVERPRLSETAMYHAFSTQMQSACLSRQVGAALVDKRGNLIATGTNEVPRAGGGVYGESAKKEDHDARCAFFDRADLRFCRNTREQNLIIEELLDSVGTPATQRREMAMKLRSTRVGALLEFSRAVHAEMDALLSAARQGVSPVGTKLFVTTFPCHYCARHIVAAGIDEVQYIEPYPKSQALTLHQDSITTAETKDWKPPSEDGTHVLFRPFRGVAPRLYRRAFMMDRELKDKSTGHMRIHEPLWTSSWYLPKISYAAMEAKLASRA